MFKVGDSLLKYKNGRVVLTYIPVVGYLRCMELTTCSMTVYTILTSNVIMHAVALSVHGVGGGGCKWVHIHSVYNQCTHDL